ncbi:MAG: sugar ABC transporter permease [Lachnospiraceae bacterium]|nr:sugar ABC transporter permease [Lachnospiraceae bacterium]
MTGLTKSKKKKKGQFGNAMMAVGPLIGFILFGAIPLILATLVSMTELHSTDLTEMRFIGLENYKTILTNGDNRTYASYLSTIMYTVMSVPISIAISLFIAYLLNRVKKGRRFFSSVMFIPYVCSTVVVGLIFKIFFREQGGIFNAILSFLGFQPVGWLTSDATTFMASTAIMTVWHGLGFSIVMFSAALGRIDEGYYEAARIDGATKFQMFWKITWSAISPTTGYLITMKLIWALQAMEQTMILVGANQIVPTWFGSDAYVSDLVVKHIYNMAFLSPYQYGYGLAAAAGWILAIIVFIVTRVNLKTQEKWVNYDF